MIKTFFGEKKMRKIWNKILCGALALITAFGISACTQKAESAYDIAVRNGFIGTEKEWLQSLRGDDGENGKDLNINDVYEWAQEQGFTGDYQAFLQSLGITAVEDNDLNAIAKNITSSVSVYCGFTETHKEGGLSDKSTIYVTASAGSGVVYSINRNAGTAIIITNYHVVHCHDVNDKVAGGADSTISECVYIYPHGELNYFSSGDEKKDGVVDSHDKDKIKDSEQGDTSGHGIRARVIGGAMKYDIAVLETEVNEKYFGEDGVMTEAVLGDSEKITVGEKTFAVGNAKGEGIAVTSGIISVDSEYISISSMDGTGESLQFRVMRTDAAINHGNSGGGLYNAKGELIGINNAKNIEEETDNIGFALPINNVKYVVENILDNATAGGYVNRATLGVKLSILESGMHLDATGKVVVKEKIAISSSTISYGTAAYGKLAYGDIIEAVTYKNEKYDITRLHHITDLLITVRKGDSITLHIVRDGVKKEVAIAFNRESYFTKFN